MKCMILKLNWKNIIAKTILPVHHIFMISHEGRKRLHRNGRVKLTDVARHAAVSTATVSRALSRPDKVRPEMLERVRASVRALGYVPDGAARALASRRSNTIGAVIPTLDNAIFARGVEALQQRLSEAGYPLLLASSEYDFDREMMHVGKLIERGIDGLVLIGHDHHPRLYHLLASKEIPYVNAWVHEADSGHPCVGFDNRGAAARIASYLMDMGHRRIAMIAGLGAGNDRARARIAGVGQALASRGLVLAAGGLAECRYDIAEGRQALRRLLARPVVPTAVICGNDVLAFAALFEARALGIAVPGALSIVGFDDLELARHVEPPLTTMQVPSTEMGRRAAEYLLARIAGEAALSVELEVNLIVRGTTAPPLSPR